MYPGNVCKFNFNRSSDIICTNFIKELYNSQSVARRARENFIGIVAKGEGVLLVNQKEYRLCRGMLFFVCEKDVFSISSEECFEYSYINFSGRRATEYIERFGISDLRCVFEGYESLIDFWNESQELAEEGNIDIVCEAVLLYSLARLKPPKSGHSDGVVARIITLTQEHFTESSLSISRVANEIGYDDKYISSLFKRRTGVPYTQFLRELRVKHALFLMEQGVASVKNVAILSGFSDPLYFSKVFSAQIGSSPREYIKKIEDEKNRISDDTADKI